LIPLTAARDRLLRYSRGVLLPDRRSFLFACAALAACRRKPELPSLGVVPAFVLTDQDGKRLGSAELRGKVWIAAFMFTRCPTICPRITRRMRELQLEALDRKLGLTLVSFSVDPENDTPEVLRAYTAAQGLDTANWRFLTGDSAVIRTTAERGFKIGVEGTPRAGSEHFGITHGTHLVLLDTRRTIRGYYQSSDGERVSALLADAARLARE
jgi:protein SCO1/2